MIGKIEQGIGSVAASEKLKEEGAAQELKGRGQKAIGDAEAALTQATTDHFSVAYDREHEIRERAYWTWLREGLPEGRERDHWHQAEKEFDAEASARSL